MTIQQVHRQLVTTLSALYDQREATNIADWVIEYVTGCTRIDRVMNRDAQINYAQQQQLTEISSALQQHKPVQYALGEAWFYGKKFLVNEHVLIPRPETEELVQWITDDLLQTQGTNATIIDIGTGSGCIPVSLKINLPKAIVTAIDVSANALCVAKKNACELKAEVEFKQIDFLNENTWHTLGSFDVIASNPPYIMQSEQASMSRHVTEHEPHLALFVPDNDALVFYNAIAKFAGQYLNKNGSIYMEINEQLGDAVVALFRQYGYKDVTLKKDLQQKDRMVRCRKG